MRNSLLLILAIFSVISFTLGVIVGNCQTVKHRFSKVENHDFSDIPNSICVIERGGIVYLMKDTLIFPFKNQWPTQKYVFQDTEKLSSLNAVLPEWKKIVRHFTDLPVQYLEKDSLGTVIVKIGDRHCTYDFYKILELSKVKYYPYLTRYDKDWYYCKQCSESSFHDFID